MEKAGHYKTLKDNQTVLLHPSRALDLKPEWCVYHEFVLTSQNYIRIVSEIQPEWLLEASEDYFDMAQFKNCESKSILKKL